MERGREGRRGVPGAGPVSAPRRPRTGGFKDNSAGEDGEDVMDDVHNPRLRERPKKDSTSSSVQGVPLGSLGSAPRNKRKRQGPHELQGQARNIIMDELDETTEDIELGASEDDDDPPPPPIPRRPGKLRPQGKFLDEGIPADLPTVPRKARTAILKRPQESPSPPVGDSCHQALTVTPRSPVPKSSGLKLRAVKAPKVSTPPVVSEQEVEVAEALFDLARMLTDQSNSSKLDVIIGKNPEPKEESKSKVVPEANLEANELASSIVPCVDLPYTPCSLPTSTDVLSPTLSPRCFPSAPMTSANLLPPRVVSSVVSALGTLPIPSSTTTALLPVTAPPAEAPKRKRPRLRTRPDLMGRVSEVGWSVSSGVISNSCGVDVHSPGLEVEQVPTSCPPQTKGSSLKAEVGLLPRMATSTLGSTTPSATLFPEPDSMGLRSRARMTASEIPEKKSTAADEIMKVDLSTTPASLHSLHSPECDRKLEPICAASPPPALPLEIYRTSSRLSGNQFFNVDLDGSYCQQQTSAQDQIPVSGKPVRFDFDLLASQVTKSSISPGSERTLEVTGTAEGDSLEKRTATLRVGPSGLPSWTDLENERDGERRSEDEIQWEEDMKYEDDKKKGNVREVEKDIVVRRERDGEGSLLRERDSSGEKDGVEDQGSGELTIQTLQKRQGKTQMPDSRALTMERTAVATAASAAMPSFLASVPLAASNVATGVSSCPLTAASISSWPVGLPPPMGSAATTAVWPGRALLGGSAGVNDNSSPTVQLPNPFTIQARHPQPWKRCASHVYIAHFIDLQQQMNRHPFMHAAYQNSANLFGAKPYNLNFPVPPGDALFGNGPSGPVLGCLSGVAEVSVMAGDEGGSGLGVLPASEGNPGVASVTTIALSKGKAFGDSLCKKQPQQPQQKQQQQPQLSPSNLSSQPGPELGFQVTQAGNSGVGGLAAAAPAACGGPTGNLGLGGGSAPVGGNSASAASSIVACPGASNGGVVSHAVAQAQYIQAVMQQGGFPFSFQAAAHFGPTFNGPPGHLGSQQTTQFFGSPFYTTHLVHPPAHPQQQVQQGTNVSVGLPSVQKQQHSLQQPGRSFPPGPQQLQQQPTLIPVTHATPQAQQQHTLNTAPQQIQHLTELDASNIGDSSSSSESKFSLLQRNVYGQGNPHVTVSVSPSASSVLEGGSQTAHPQNFTLLSALGPKQQQVPLTHQHQQPQAGVHVGALAVQTSFKGADEQTSETFSAMSITSLNRGPPVGPGPLGLAPVAAVMAPQGHAMLHGVADVSRGHSQHQQPQNLQPVTAPSHQHSLQSGPQHRGAVQIPKATSPMVSGEDSRTLVDGNTIPIRSGREAVEDRKLPSKRGLISSNFIRVDLDTPSSVQGASSGSGLLHPRSTGSGGPTLNLMTPAPSILLSRPVGHPSGSGQQQPGTTLPGTQNSKLAPQRSKLLAGLGGGVLVSSNQSQLSFSDKPSQPIKIQGTSVSSPGQNILQSTQVPRQGQMPQHSQLKFSNRSSLGSLPTPSGTAPQAVLAAAIAKSQQIPQQQQSRTQAQVVTGSSTRLPSSNCGSTSTSTSIPLPPLPPVSKSAPTSASKVNATIKNAFTVSQKPSSGVSSKRATPPSVSHVSSTLGSSPLGQNLPMKSPQSQHHAHLPSMQPQQNVSQYHTHPSNLPQQSAQQPLSHPSQSLMPPQYQQQAHASSQQQLHQAHSKQVLTQHSHQMQRVYLQKPAFQPLQQSSGSEVNPLPHQQSSHQVLHQTSPSSKSQQRATSPQQQQQSRPQQPTQQKQHSSQGGTGPTAETTSNASLSLSPPTLTLGTGSTGSTSCARPPCSDSVAPSQGPGSRSNSTNKISGSGAAQSSSRSNTGGPSFLPTQFVSNVSSGLQQSGSPRNSPGPQHLQAIMNAEAGTKLAEQKVMTDGNGLEQVNGIRSMSNSSSLMGHMPQSSSPGLPPISAHQMTAANLVGKSLGVPSGGSNYSEGFGSRNGFVLTVAPPNLSSNSISQSSNPKSNVDNTAGIDSTGHLV